MDALTAATQEIERLRTRISALETKGDALWHSIFARLNEGFVLGEVIRDAGGAVVDWRYLEVNGAWTESVGIEYADVIGRTVRELIPGIEDIWVSEFGAVVDTGETARFTRQIGVFGRWYDGHVFALGQDRFGVLFLEVTERKRTESTLKAHNDTLLQQVDVRTRERDRHWQLSPVIMVVGDAKGFLLAINPAWTQTLGWDAEETIGRDVMDFVAPEDHAVGAAGMEKLLAGNAVVDYQNTFVTKTGERRRIAWTTVPENGHLYGYGRDITDQIETEEKLRQAQKMEAIGQLTGGLAHDFNNLLTGISGSLELVKSRVAQGRFADVERYLAAAQGATGRAAALTHRLLAFARRQTLDPKPANVNRLIAGMVDLLRRTVGPEISVEVVSAGGLWPTLVDASQLENALLNLCINARDAMPDGGKLTIETANRSFDKRSARENDLPQGEYISMCVSDTGTGMSRDVAAKAFDPFFTTKPIGMGTGLGLSMIHGFARQSGGAVRIYSEPGSGTMVCVYLPRHHTIEAAQEAGTAAASSTAGATGQTVLVVDDEPTIRMLLLDLLGELGYATLEASEAGSALDIIESGVRLDLLISDVGLPGGINGRQLADAARMTRPDLKVLFITGYAENAVLSHGQLETGMHVLTKPFSLDTLGDRVRILIAGE